MAMVASSRTFAEELKRCGDPPVRVGDLTVTSAPAAKDALAEQLRKFPSKRGLSLHQMSAHPDIYHREKIPTVVRKGWSHDECVFVAREELRLVGEARKRWVRNRVNVNADLCRACPHRSLEAIKGLRKNDKYITLREKLGQQESESPPTEPPESPVRDYSVQNVARKWTTPEPKDRTDPKVRWSEELLDEVARWEDRLSLVGCTDINKQLSYLFPERSLEGIKGMRILPKYKARAGRCAEVEALADTLPVTQCPGATMMMGAAGRRDRPMSAGRLPQLGHVIPGA